MQLSPVEYEKRYFLSLESVWGTRGDSVSYYVIFVKLRKQVDKSKCLIA